MVFQVKATSVVYVALEMDDVASSFKVEIGGDDNRYSRLIDSSGSVVVEKVKHTLYSYALHFIDMITVAKSVVISVFMHAVYDYTWNGCLQETANILNAETEQVYWIAWTSGSIEFGLGGQIYREVCESVSPVTSIMH